MIEWFNSVLGEAVGTYAAIGVGLLIVIVLIIVLLRILRSFGSGMFGNKGQNRLGVIEAAAVDNKRRLVLVRRDNVEHLIMIGGTSDILVEAGINRSAPTQRPPHPPETKPLVTPINAPKPALTQSAPKQLGTQGASSPAPAAAAVSPQQAKAQPSPAPSPVPASAQPAQQQAQTQAQATQVQPQAPQTAAAVNPQSAPASPPTQAAMPTKTTAPVITPPSDSAKVGDDMDRLLNQIAGDAKG